MSRIAPKCAPYNPSMKVQHILDSIDADLDRLRNARAKLAALSEPAKRGPGRPKTKEPEIATKRTMSAAGRARIAAAQKKRWAAAKAANS